MLRGDTAGEYDLSADFTGTLSLFNAPVNAVFKTNSPIKVYGLEGVKFRRQFSVGPFIIDFYNSETRLGIELDGNPHFTPEGHNYDMQRTEYFKTQHNITILRFENADVFKCPEGVLTKIRNTIKEIKENQLPQQSDSSTTHTE